LTFSKPDCGTFPCLCYAYEAIEAGGTAPAVLSGANEVAVEAFLSRRIGFSAIADTVRRVLDRYRDEQGFSSDNGLNLTLLREADGRAREMARLMQDILSSAVGVLGALFSFGFAIFIHELGHFLVPNFPGWA
jgi:1-deoxy-D-xylulose-5-phosphate reductoisomerase